MRRALRILALFALPVTAVAQHQCDCSKIVGGCTATLEVTDPKGQNSNYSAGLKIRASAPQCARVEYFIDTTPHRTLLFEGSIAFENIFGTKPISQQTVSFERCTVCALKGAAAEAAPEKKPDLTATLQGSWCWSKGIASGRNTFSGNSVQVNASALGFPGSNSGSFVVTGERQFRITLTNRVQNVELLDNNTIRWEDGTVATRC